MAAAAETERIPEAETGNIKEPCIRTWGLTSFGLHIIAMVLMLCDHLWATVVPGNMWLTNLGRMAFPIFAFMNVEGFFHTKDLGKYMKRLLVCALISEIPFNLMYGGSVLYPYHQNVIWTFLIGILCMAASKKLTDRMRIPGILLSLPVFLAGALAATVLMTDYYAFGVLMIAVFYFFHGNRWYQKLLQILGLYFINVNLLGGMMIDVSVCGHTFEIVQQGIAVCAMIFILLYSGRQGPENKVIRYIFYLFYPVHMLILSLISLYLM